MPVECGDGTGHTQRSPQGCFRNEKIGETAVRLETALLRGNALTGLE